MFGFARYYLKLTTLPRTVNRLYNNIQFLSVINIEKTCLISYDLLLSLTLRSDSNLVQLNIVLDELHFFTAEIFTNLIVTLLTMVNFVITVATG